MYNSDNFDHSYFHRDNNSKNKKKNKNKYKHSLDDDSKDLKKLNKSFKQRKRAIEEEDDEWERWKDNID